MKKIISLALAAVLVVSLSLFSGCKEKKDVIGIIQFGTHDSLNNCYKGIMKGLKENVDMSKYDVEYVNSNFTAETSLAQAKKLVNKNAKVIIAIATPSAIQAASAATGSGIPIVYCAVTDAKQVANFENITGTSDIPDFTAQLKLVTDFLGKKDVKIGVLASTEESSDEIQISSLKKEAKKYAGMEIITETVADITTIDAKTNSLVDKKVDCLVNLLDNTVVGKLSNILEITNKANIPVFGSEVEQVKAGCIASASIDYKTVGKLAGEQAADILNGKDVNKVKPKTMENNTYPYYNSEVLKKFNMHLPNGYEIKDVIKK